MNTKRKDELLYGIMSVRHQTLARKICNSPGDEILWRQLYEEIKEHLIFKYASRLRDLCGITVDEFWLSYLWPHLAKNDCEVLIRFLSMVDNGRGYVHFGNPRFLAEIMSAYNAVPEIGVKVGADPVSQLGKPNNQNGGEEDHNDDHSTWGKDSRPTPDLVVEAGDYDKHGKGVFRGIQKSGGFPVLNRIVREQWRSNPLDSYLAACFGILELPQRDIATLLGFKTVNNVAQRLKRWREKMVARHGDEFRAWLRTSVPSMDGEAERSKLEDLSTRRNDLLFYSAKDSSIKWKMVLHLPFIVEPSNLIRIVVSGAPVGSRLRFGHKLLRLSEYGTSEIAVSDFAEVSNSADIAVVSVDGSLSAGSFYGSQELPEIPFSIRNFDFWAGVDSRKADPQSVASLLLNMFGPVLSQLLVSPNMLRTLPFERFGVPVLPREKFRHAGGEAWILVRHQNLCEGSVLDPDGFVLPVEWVKTAFPSGHRCPAIPSNLNRVAWDVQAAFGEEGHWWGIQLAERFFADRLQIEDGLFGADDVQVASSAVALGVALRYAIDGYDNPSWPFVSAQFNPRTNRIGPVGGIAAKMSVAKEYGADCVCVAAGQEGLPTDKDLPSVRVLKSTDLKAASSEVAYGHLARFMPDVPTSFGPIHGWKPSRGGIIESLTAPLNDRKNRELIERGRYMVLLGPPGIGKSTLMAELEERQSGAHTCVTYVCRAGVSNQGIAFVKSLTYGLACRFGDYAKALQAMKPLPKNAAGNELKSLYRDYVYQPFRDLASQRKKQSFNLIVDGVDEDVSGEILNLLTDPSLRYNRNISVAISSRSVAQDVDRLKACATNVVDLKCGDKPNIYSVADKNKWAVKTLIRHGLLFHPRIKLVFAKSGLDVDETVERIYKQEGTFLYANAVLTGIDTGVYSFSQLEKELPCGIRACYYDRFKVLFPNAKAYTRVKPLLKPLVEHGECEEQTLGERIVRDNDERIGTLIQLMGGYVERKNGMLRLTSESLREWLSDLAGNPEFSVVVKKKRGRMS